MLRQAQQLRHGGLRLTGSLGTAQEVDAVAVDKRGHGNLRLQIEVLLAAS